MGASWSQKNYELDEVERLKQTYEPVEFPEWYEIMTLTKPSDAKQHQVIDGPGFWVIRINKRRTYGPVLFYVGVSMLLLWYVVDPQKFDDTVADIPYFFKALLK